jgi:phosphate transport system permease protein
VLLTAGFTASLNADPLHGPMVSLPLAAFELIKSSEEFQRQRGFAAATVLLMFVLVLFVIARIIGGRGAGQLSNRARRRAAARSKRDAERLSHPVEVPGAASPEANLSTTSPAGHPEGDATS